MALSDNQKPEILVYFKHAVKSFTLDSEVYEAEQTEVNLENLKQSADILAGLQVYSWYRLLVVLDVYTIDF